MARHGKSSKGGRFEPLDSLLGLAAAATLDYIAATRREKEGRNRSRKVDPYAVAGAAMGLGKLNTTDDVLKLGGILGAMGAFDSDDGPDYSAKHTRYAWRLNCEDGSDYGIDPAEYETRTEYNHALCAAKQRDHEPVSKPSSGKAAPSAQEKESRPIAKKTVVMCWVSLLQSGQNKDYLANDEPLKVGDCAK